VVPINCPYCTKHFPDSDKIGNRHKSVCPGWQAQADKPLPCLCGYEAFSLPTMSRHRRKCLVWQSRDKTGVKTARWKATLRKRHGVESFRQIPGLEERRQKTLREKYGATNPFSKESSLYAEIEAKRAPKRPAFPKGTANPMCQPEAKERQRASLQESYGVDHPLQSPLVQEQLRQTCLDRYGVEHPGNIPQAIEKRRATNEGRFGGPAPACSPEVVEKMVASFLRIYGVRSPLQNPVVQAKALKTLRERHGVDHPLQSPEIHRRMVETSIRRYGVPYAMQNPEVARRAAQAARQVERGEPNKLEAKFAALNPELAYTGNGTFWRWLPKLGHHKNPDFILPGPDPRRPRKGVTKVVELFGDYWHSRMFTGSANFEHEQQLVEAFRNVGIECLVVWESEFKADPDACRKRMLNFLL